MTKTYAEQTVLIAKALLYVMFAVLFITNNSRMEWLAKRIRRDMIQPYSNRYSIVYIQPTEYPEEPTTVPTDTLVEPTMVVTPRPVQQTVPVQGVSISEEELWNALTLYRQAHGRKSLNRSELLCQYARKRTNELIERLKTSPDDPLDNHEGFKRDADSGYVFESTGYNYVGENLAFTPSYTSATQVIEWGWDTSSGHRELQLSDDISNGCIAGIHPVFVGIYSY